MHRGIALNVSAVLYQPAPVAPGYLLTWTQLGSICGLTASLLVVQTE